MRSSSKKMRRVFGFGLFIALVLGTVIYLKATNFAYWHMATTWLEGAPETLECKTIGEIPPPKGYTRTQAAKGSFGEYLRSLKLKQGENTVYLYNGEKKGNQTAHWGVIDIDTGNKDLQQCADVTMRLWGEYLYSQKRYGDIKFNFLSDGKPRYFKDYANGDHSYENFRKYMDWVFTYANTASLYHELKTVELIDLAIGDLFIFKGVPIGHAIIVADIALNSEGEKVFLLVQGYMPAQDMHVLKNPIDGTLSPWYSANFGTTLTTPEFVFDEATGYKIKRYGL